VAFLPYFRDDTFIDDFVDTYPGAFNSYQSLSKEEYSEYLKNLTPQGYPDVFMLSPEFQTIFEDSGDVRPKYVLVAIVPSKMWNKHDSLFYLADAVNFAQNRMYIYMTPEYAEKCGLNNVPVTADLPPNDGIIMNRK
jgi:hypothetical protein